MSKLATKSDLQEMYSRILPYLGGQADAGFTPVGTVISVMGTTAPENYLACNGQVVNIADYPELSDYFYVQFGSKSYFGGNGTTTFGIPDLRGEFLRGSGTNSHSNCGNGGSVGTHQNPTAFPYMYRNGSNAQFGMSCNVSGGLYSPNSDKSYMAGTGASKWTIATGTLSQGPASDWDTITVRPTNTSVLYCIATKNIYLNPSLDYSTSEKVVGHWIDGSTLFQKTVKITTLPNENMVQVPHGISNINEVVNVIGTMRANSSYPSTWVPVPRVQDASANACMGIDILQSNIQLKARGTNISSVFDLVYVTIQYTKTT